MATELENAYAAGIIAGEGCIRLGKNPASNNYCPRVFVGNTDRKMVEWLHSRYGGSEPRLHAASTKRPKNKPYWMWNPGRQDAIKFLTQIEPYLQQKRSRARLALALLRRFPPRGGVKKTPWELGFLEHCFEAFKRANKKGRI